MAAALLPSAGRADPESSTAPKQKCLQLDARGCITLYSMAPLIDARGYTAWCSMALMTIDIQCQVCRHSSSGEKTSTSVASLQKLS